MEALGIKRFMVAGHDWSSNAAEALAVGWPKRVQRMCMLSTPSRLGGMPTPPFEQCQRQWRHWFQATERGQKVVREDPKGFAHIMWMNWSPRDWFDEAEFDRTLKLPTLYIQGEVDGVNPPSASANVPEKFSGPFEFLQLPGVGHFLPREAPEAVASALIRWFKPAA